MLAPRRFVHRLFLGSCLVLVSAALAGAQEQERPPLPDYLNVSISEALSRGKSYLQRSQLANGTWAPGTGQLVGYAALPALTLLELGVPAKDPGIQRAAQYVRYWVKPKGKDLPVDNTYDVSLAVLFLDRLGDPKDKGNIETLVTRLIAGQTPTGGWSYKVPVLRDEDTDLVLNLIRKIEPLPLQDLLGGRIDGLNNPFVKNFPRKAEEPTKAKTYAKVKIPPQLVDLPVLNDFKRLTANLVDPEAKGQQPLFGTTDNSTTQFAMLALWAGRRHKIPATRTGSLSFMRYHTSQASDGGWNYPYKNGGNGTTITMINPGLLGLAIGHGLVREMGLVDEPAADEDPRLHQGFLALSRHIGDPQDRIKDLPMPNLYFLWSVERVAVLFKMELIGTKDWYRWGAEALIANQNPESGHWEKSSYPGGDGANAGSINTSFALLFLKRANLAEDLSKYLVNFSPKKLNDSVVNLSPKPPPVVVKPEVKPEPPKPVQVAEAKPPPVITPEPEAKPPEAPPTMPRIAPPVTPPVAAAAPPPSSGGGWWVWLLIGLGGLLVVGGILAVVLLGTGGGRADDDEEEERRPKKKKPKRR